MRYALLILLGAFLFLFSGCRKCDDPCNKECDNYDPCCATSPLTAEFAYYEDVDLSSFPYLKGLKKRIIEADTVLDTSPVLFKAEFEDADEYTWRVGNDPREWSGKEFRLRFRDVPSGTSVPVTLTVRKTNDRICNPDAESEVSFTKNVVVMRPEFSPLIGRFQGIKKSTPSETIIVHFTHYSPDTEPPNLNNMPQIDWLFPNCGGELIELKRLSGYDFMYFNFYDIYYCCFEAQGFAWINENDELEIEFKHFPSNNSNKDSCDWSNEGVMIIDHFKGKRVL